MPTFNPSNCFQKFNEDVSGIKLPEKFTFPFLYEPSEIALVAVNELKKCIQSRDWNHNFDSNQPSLPPVGKMFGVLVVQSTNGDLGYLSAFSGKLGEDVLIEPFVPPIFDRLTEDSYFLQGKVELNSINDCVNKLETSTDFAEWRKLIKTETEYAQKIISEEKEVIKKQKKIRREIKSGNITSSELIKLNEESLREQLRLKRLKRYWRSRLEFLNEQANRYSIEIEELKIKRKAKSNALQKKIFSEYKFLNYDKNWKSLWKIFEKTANKTPPSGAGDCCAPKLLQFAYEHNFKPISMAEFWWGKSPNSIIRKHEHFYPACKGKCEPILGHMLKGLNVDSNPLLCESKPLGDVKVVFQDESILIVSKPSGLLSVPGKELIDSVLVRLTEQFKNEFIPRLLHRLDMATSGVMIFAKTKRAHKNLQKQFLNRVVKKKYVALLDGEIKTQEGEINLPLRVDYENRPSQMVCYEHGKHAITKYDVIEVKNGKTLVHFFPVTGRTHQLRMHASHSKGLNTPIVGDILYGKKDSRLHLHAETISFIHPIEKKEMSFTVKADFNPVETIKKLTP
ncbi:MAG: RNA pseudouridine synthase [Flavobacteriales bacterium]|nr:RNA pseudouridine synthase [Flavobacteriales bacterium]|tara:strand:- start:2788 stop:4485 length:1698 start_codon:yes stop_codon:yes gene_type:complete